VAIRTKYNCNSRCQLQLKLVEFTVHGSGRSFVRSVGHSESIYFNIIELFGLFSMRNCKNIFLTFAMYLQ
jgi:hypothetical protein